MILENCKHIKIKGLGNLDDITGLIFVAGRYVGVLIPDIDKQLIMAFYDCKKDTRFALKVADNFVAKTTQQLFMKNFEKATTEYDKYYDAVELVVGSGLFPTPSAN